MILLHACTVISNIKNPEYLQVFPSGVDLNRAKKSKYLPKRIKPDFALVVSLTSTVTSIYQIAGLFNY